jgi:phosphotriesterase-related protein
MNFNKNAFNRRDFINRGSLSLGSIVAAGLPFSTALLSSCKTAKPNAKPNTNTIPTLTGSIKSTELGTTLMHEHILWFAGPMDENAGYTPIPDDLKQETVDFAVSALNDAARVGINTVVDLTPFRPIDLYEQIAKRTPVNIIASTGFYRRSKVPKWMADMEDEKQMEERMLKEVTEGIEGTKIRAGIIKVAGEGGTDWQKKTFRAAARVNKATGVPIATHSGTDAFEQFNFLVKAGADPHRIFYSHVDVGRKGKPGDLLTIAKEGGYLEVDTFGQNFYTPWNELVSFLRAFCDAGFASKVIISIDSNWHWEDGKKVFEGGGPPNFDPNAANRTFAYMVTDAVPMLLKSGFSMKEINTFLVDNPRNYFSK